MKHSKMIDSLTQRSRFYTLKNATFVCKNFPKGSRREKKLILLKMKVVCKKVKGLVQLARTKIRSASDYNRSISFSKGRKKKEKKKKRKKVFEVQSPSSLTSASFFMFALCKHMAFSSLSRELRDCGKML